MLHIHKTDITSREYHHKKQTTDKKWWKLVVFLFILTMVVAACQKDSTDQNGKGSKSNDPKETIRLSEAVQELSIWQVTEHGTEEIVTYEGGAHDSPVLFAIHESEVMIRLRLHDHVVFELEQLVDSIRVTGAEYRLSSSSNENGWDIILDDISEEVEVYVSDLEKISLQKTDSHLTYMLNQSSLKSPYSLLIHSRLEGKSHIFVSEEEESVVIRFSEPMIRIERPGSEWLSDTQLQIRLDALTDGEWDLREYYSSEGNFISRRTDKLMIHPTPPRTWLNAASGGHVGWSDRDKYYDSMIFSPDNTKYAGIVRLSEDEQGRWAYYGIVIERPGKAPVVIDHTIHAKQSSMIPVEWMDSNTLLLLSAFEVYAYDIEEGTTRLVTGNDGEEQVIAFDFDRRTGRLFVLSQMHEQSSGQSYMRGSLRVYDPQFSLTDHIQSLTDPWPASENATMPLAIRLQQGGYYLTTYEEGKTVTYYRSSGDEVSAPGYLIGVTDRGAYLAEFADDDKVTALYWWPVGGEVQTITPLPNAIYLMFGGDLFARLERATDTYYGYSLGRDEWVEWSPNDGRDSWIPNQRTAYYRVED